MANTNPYTDSQKTAYLQSISGTKPQIIQFIQEIGRNSLSLWINAMDSMSDEDLQKSLAAIQQAGASQTDDMKKAGVIGLSAAAAVVNVVPVAGQIVSAVLAALAAILNSVPSAKSALGPNFSTAEAVEWATYRGFTRRYMIQHDCLASSEGRQQGYGIGGPGTPSWCNENLGGMTAKQKFINKVNNTLLNLGKYINVPDILNYFPEGPAAKNPSPAGDKSPALYLIEAFDSIPPFESASVTQRQEIVDQLISKGTIITHDGNLVKQQTNWFIIGIGVTVCVAILARKPKESMGRT